MSVYRFPHQGNPLTSDFATVLAEYEPRIRRRLSAAFARIRNIEPIDDLVQVALIALWDRHKSFDPSRGIDFWSYANRRVYGAVVDHLRRSGLHRKGGVGTGAFCQLDGFSEETHAAIESQYLAVFDDQEAAFVAFDFLDDCRLANLTWRQKELLAKVYVQGHTHAAIATEAGVSRSHVAAQLEGARDTVIATMTGVRPDRTRYRPRVGYKPPARLCVACSEMKPLYSKGRCQSCADKEIRRLLREKKEHERRMRINLGDRVKVVIPDNKVVHGQIGRVRELHLWGAILDLPASASGQFRCLFEEMKLMADEDARLAREHGFSGDTCSTCGSLKMVRAGVCLRCSDCGNTTGCS